MKEKKTKVKAIEGEQTVFIEREFDLPVSLLFRAYVEANLVEQWMGTKVIKLESKSHGSYEYETKDHRGRVVLKSTGVIHELITNQRIIRTFEMVDTPYPVQMEFLDFISIDDDHSMLKMQVVYKSVAARNEILKLPFEYGINMAHDKLQEVANKLNQ